MTAPMEPPWKNLPTRKAARLPMMSFGRYEMNMIATASAERKDEIASARRRPILSCSHPPKTEPPIAPKGDATFQAASQGAGRIHLPT